MFAVLHYADNLDIRTNFVAGVKGEMAPDRVSIGEEAARHRLVDDGDLLATGHIRVGEFSPAEKWNAHCGEVIRPNTVTVKVHVFTFLRLIPFHCNIRTRVAIGE